MNNIENPHRDAYELTVTATDEGTPPKTGYTKVIVKIIDINDNQPQFPQPAPISVSEGKNIYLDLVGFATLFTKIFWINISFKL